MEDWKKAWRPMVDAVGKDFSEGEKRWGADEVEKGAIRRFLEPLEFDCPLHYDRDIAKKYGYEDIIAPYSSLLTWTIIPHWSPGMEIFTDDDPNAQPTFNPTASIQTDLAPKTTGYFATDIEIDYHQPIVKGDHLYRKGYVLLSCVPKETRVGQGAFMTWETEVYNQRDELVATLRFGTYSYNPKESEEI